MKILQMDGEKIQCFQKLNNTSDALQMIQNLEIWSFLNIQFKRYCVKRLIPILIGPLKSSESFIQYLMQGPVTFQDNCTWL